MSFTGLHANNSAGCVSLPSLIESEFKDDSFFFNYSSLRLIIKHVNRRKMTKLRRINKKKKNNKWFIRKYQAYTEIVRILLYSFILFFFWLSYVVIFVAQLCRSVLSCFSTIEFFFVLFGHFPFVMTCLTTFVFLFVMSGLDRFVLSGFTTLESLFI